MRNLLISLIFAFTCIGGVYAQTASEIKPVKSSKHLKLFDDATVYLDSGETYADTKYYDIRNLRRNAATTVLGTFGVKCQDSSGTDTMDVTLNIYGNYASDGNGAPEGEWVSLGTVSITDPAGALVEGVGTITTANDVLFLWPKLINDETGAGAGVGEKSACTDVYWTVRPPLTQLD